MADYLPPVVSELVAKTDRFRADMLAAQRSMAAVEKQGGSSFDKLAKVGKAAFFGLGAAAVGLGAIAVKGAEEQEAANARLATALHNVGSSLSATSKPFEDAQAAARRLGFEDDQATDSMARLTAATRSPAKAIRDLALAEDISRGRKIDLAAATDILTKVETGHVALLGRIGINTKDETGATISQEEAIRRLSDLYGGQASAYSKTFAGRLATLRAESNELAENVGNVLVPKIEALAHSANASIEWLRQHSTAAKALAVVVGGPLAVAMGAYVVQQARSLALSGAQLALRVPQFFLSVGAAMQGTTASSVVLNATTSATTSTMLLGATAVVGVTAALAAMTMQIAHNRAEARTWAHEFSVAAGAPQQQIEADKKKIQELQDQIDKHGVWGHVPFVRMAFDAQATEDKIAGLKGEVHSLEAGIKGQAAAAAAAAGPNGELGDTFEEAQKKADELEQKISSIESSVSGAISAQKSYQDSLSRVHDASSSVADAHRALDVAISKAVVDTKAVAAAQRELRAADEGVTAAADRLTKARERLAEVERGAAPRDLLEAELRVSEALRGQERAALALKDKQETLRKLQFDSTRTADDYHSAQLDVADAQAGVTEASLDAQRAQEELSRLQREGKAGSDELTGAQSALADAERGLRDAQEQQQAAQERLAQANTIDPGLTDAVTAARGRLIDAEHGLRDAKDGVASSALAAAEAEIRARDEMAKSAPAAAELRDRLDEIAAAWPAARPAIAAIEALLPARLAAGSDAVLESYRAPGATQQRFAGGGWVQGPPGAPVPAIVHGGEFVVSRDMMRSGGPSTGTESHITNIYLDGRKIAEVIEGPLRERLNNNAKRNALPTRF